MVVLHYFGPEAVRVCQKTATIIDASSKLIYVSEEEKTVQSQIENIWNLAEMKMN